ncbi:zinc finger matrin-type protein 2-like [Halichondria panicea]|uniref:zinc finger matrin-type protein 2-like n=1 Tax=Halichondria panicea TaxID=6063 RepID=UPI00312B8605
MAGSSQDDLDLGGGDSFRRTWDSRKYEKLARDRADTDREGKNPSAPVKREMLKARDYRVDLDSRLGRSIVITKNTPQAQTGGYFCNVCDCVVKDSINFLDHINGKKHQRNMGMSMKVEKSTVDQVRKRFEFNKKKKEEEKKKYDFEERLKEVKEDEEKYKEYRKEKKRERKRKDRGEEDEDTAELDPELSAMMGFSGFGAKKKAV